jgi:hypothetical protein
VLVVRTLGSSPSQRRRRRRARAAEPGAEPSALPLTRVTAIRAFEPFADREEARRWLEEAVEASDTIEVLLADALALLNRALHAQAVAGADPRAVQELGGERAVAARIGYGTGEETAASLFSEAREVDATAGGLSRRRQREEELRPQERVAAVLGGRERLDACETLLLRARLDLDAGREREAALQLRVGREALLAELRGALSDPGHEKDVGELDARRSEAGEAANAALAGSLEEAQLRSVEEILAICERVLRRRRVLRG